MSFISRFQAIDDKEKTRAVRQLIESSTPDFDYFFMLVLSVLMATFGLLAGSEAIVIGAMLLAPLLAPIMGLSLGTSMSHHPLIGRSLSTIGYSIMFSVGAAVIGAFLFSVGDLHGGINDVILSRTEPSLLFFIVAVISGFAVAYTTVRPNLSSTLPGVAIAVALIPPLAVIGIGIAMLNPAIVAGSVVMFFINVAGIVFAGMVTFSLMDVHHKSLIAETTIKKEQKRVEEETEKIKKIDEEIAQE
ncbi:DUF389 domain-containing protein [Candidatus Kaiserbacteria bacterium]|nr:MAG: DUF389 domain-containing protein [Candidatus Kaiserbacteria bacterium]